jgi:hypothetical protein
MSMSRRHRSQSKIALLGALLAGLAAPLAAHHGWAWAEEEQSNLKGVIQSVSMAAPHPSLKVKAASGAIWLVELANPLKTEQSGFNAGSAKPGDRVVVIGNRDRDRSKPHMKAVRVTVGGKTYDIYPERITRS